MKCCDVRFSWGRPWIIEAIAESWRFQRSSRMTQHLFVSLVEDFGSLFEKRDFKERQRTSGTKSTLSLRLEQCPQQLNNPFNEYSKFDGKVIRPSSVRLSLARTSWLGLLSDFQGHVGTTATKKIDVYLSMQTTQEKLHPMTVVTIANARVHDLIGLICWQYTSEGREPKLKWAEQHPNGAAVWTGSLANGVRASWLPQWECERLLSPHCWGWWRSGHWLPPAGLQRAHP